VPDSGFSANHHFLLSEDGTIYNFVAGIYQLDVYATIVGRRTARLLYTVKLPVTPAHGEAIKEPGQGLYYDWGPEASAFNAHIRPQPRTELPSFLHQLIDESAPERDS
jgi:hypothetical protein